MNNGNGYQSNNDIYNGANNLYNNNYNNNYGNNGNNNFVNINEVGYGFNSK